jgi:uncharacterized membrane protein YeiH
MENGLAKIVSASIKENAGQLLFVADMAGTFLFGLEGALAGIRGNLDLIGVMVLAFATALGGGIIRDLLIGAIPPASLRDWRYAALAFGGGTIAFFLYNVVQGIPGNLMMVLDATGLALFAIAGTEKALEHKMSGFIAVLMGTITGVGGGAVRDVLLAQVPRVLRAEVYATAAIVGSVCMVSCRKLKVSPTVSAILGGAVCFLLRVVSVWRHWNLPTGLPR